MARFSKGRRALAISDRSGAAFPYDEMVKEWTGALVHISEFEPKQPQLQPHPVGADPQALKNARLVIKKTKCDAIKLEGGRKIIPIVKTLVKKKIPVMGHLGILPQTDKKFTFKGRQIKEITNLLRDAKNLEEAGIFSVVLECVETTLAKKITKHLKIPTIGIGSSSNCDGQILVTDDMLGISGFYPKFVKKYASLDSTIEKAVKKYTRDVKKGKFPLKKNFLNGTKYR